MSENDHLATVRAWIDASNSGGSGATEGFCDPEVEFVEDPEFPGAETHRGVDKVVSAFARWTDSFEDYRLELESAVESDERVVMVVRESGRGVSSGVEVERRIGWLLSFRDSKLLRMEVFLDPDDAVRAGGLSPEDDS